MEYRSIKTFLRVAEQLSFVKAAEILGYSQATITVQIHQLEDELNTRLFDRIGKRVKLTAAGEAFIPYAQNIVKANIEAKDFLKSHTVPPGELFIDVSSSVSSVKMPKLLSAFTYAYPQIVVHVRTTDYMLDEFDKIAKNEIDFLYLVDKQFLHSDMVSAATKEEPIVFVGNVDNPLTKKETVSLSEIVTEPFIITNREVSYCYYLDQYLWERGMEINTIMEISATDVIVKLLCAGNGISYLPYFTVKEEIENGRLAVINADYPKDTVWSQLLYHKNKWISPQMRAFIEFAEKSTE